MIRVTVSVDDDVLEELQRTVRRSGALAKRAFKRQVTRERTRLLSELRYTPPKPTYPLRWQSPKQRAAFFATNGFGKGIPYQRTGKLNAGWDLTTVENANEMSVQVENATPYARFVVGDDAQRMHLDTGWRQAAPVIANSRERLNDRLIDTWFTLTDERAGVTP
jgi:hypothetical protein